jgi:hypothetical protein
MSIEDRREAVKELAGRGDEVRRERVGGGPSGDTAF